MGWDYHNEMAPYDRRAICRRHIGNGYEVIKDAMVGTTYYAAVKSPHDGSVSAVVILTHIDRGGWCNFGMKFIDEDMGPLHYDCPESILRELSPTANSYALEWRAKCRERRQAKRENVLVKAPIGSKLKVTLKTGVERIVTKQAPNFQFKSWWLLAEGALTYIPRNRVEKAEVVL